MILHEIFQNESNQIYQDLETSNLDRQYRFLHSVVTTAIDVDSQFLSQTVIKAINYHSIACLHVNAGEYRPCDVFITGDGDQHIPPEHWRVSALMDDFVNTVNRQWKEMNAFQLAAYVLWRLNWIHPFINGNGRTARAVCFFVFCVHVKSWIGKNIFLPEILKENRNEYIQMLRYADSTSEETTEISSIILPVSSLIIDLFRNHWSNENDNES